MIGEVLNTAIQLQYFANEATGNPSLARQLIADTTKRVGYGTLSALSLYAFKEVTIDMGIARFAIITGNSELKNAISLPLIKSLIDACTQINIDPNISIPGSIFLEAALASSPLVWLKRLTS